MSQHRSIVHPPALAAALALLAGSGVAGAEGRGDPLAGARWAVGSERPFAAAAACSAQRPLCVHVRREADGAAALALLDALERAHAGLIDALALPAPLRDGALGGGPAFDAYLLDAPALVVAPDPPTPGGLDRASAFATVPLREARSPGARLDHLAARALAEAIALGIDAAEGPVLRAGRAAYLAGLVAPGGDDGLAALDDAQLHPERSVAGDLGGSRLLAWWLDATRGAGRPGALPLALSVLGAQRTPPASASWRDEPDLFDVLRASFGGDAVAAGARASSDLLLELAVARAFLGDRDDGLHLAESAWLGAAGRVKFAWSLPWATLPRRVTGVPIEPAGAGYLWIDLDGAPPGAGVALRLEWEAPVPFRWAVLRIARDGTLDSRVDVTREERTRSAERTIEAVPGIAGLILVATNVGDDDLDTPFDPDDVAYEPHGWVVTVAPATP